MSVFKKGQTVYIIDASKRTYQLIECVIISERSGLIKVKGERNKPYVFQYDRTINGIYCDSFKEYFLSDNYEKCSQIVERHNLRAEILKIIREQSSSITTEQFKKIKEILISDSNL